MKAQLALLEVPAERPDSTTDTRHKPLLDAMATIYRQARGESLVVTGRTAKDVQAILAHATRDFGMTRAPFEVVARWRRALAASYPRTSTPGELLRNWGHFAATLDFDPNQGILR